MEENDGNLLVSVFSFLAMILGIVISYKFHLPIACLILFVLGSFVFGGVLIWDLIKFFRRNHKK